VLTLVTTLPHSSASEAVVNGHQGVGDQGTRGLVVPSPIFHRSPTLRADNASNLRAMRRHLAALLAAGIIVGTLAAPMPGGAAAEPRIASSAAPTMGIAVTLGFANLISDNRAVTIANELMPTIATRFHANAVSLNFPFWEASSTSSDPMRAPMTPSPQRLVAISEIARRCHLRVQWRPYLFEGDLKSQIRDSIHPVDPKAWLQHYWNFLVPYLEAANLSGVSSFSIALELRTLLPHLSIWTTIVERAKTLFSGQLLYSQQHLPQVSLPLTARGYDAYEPIKLPRGQVVSTAAFTRGFEENLQSPEMQSTPADLTVEEVSLPAVSGANRQPNDFHYPLGTKLDRQVQTEWFAGACNAFWALHLQGIYYFAIAFNRFTSAENQSASLYGWLGTSSAGAISQCFSRAAGPAAAQSQKAAARLQRAVPSSWAPSEPVEPSGGDPTSISCPTSSFCAMVDAGGDVLTETSGVWSAPRNIDGGDLVGVSCASATLCVAVDGSGNAWSFDGSSWTASPGVDPEPFTSVSCAIATSTCIAVDVAGDAVEYSEGAWVGPLRVAAGPLTAVSCASATSCRAVDATGEVYTFNGSWSSPTRLGINGLTSIACPSTSVCAAGDDTGHLFLRTKGRWVQQNYLLDSGVASVACSSTSSCLALATTSMATTSTASSWTAHDSDLPVNSGVAVSCPPGGACVAASYDGVVSTYAGTWSATTVVDPRPGELTDVSCGSSSFCMAVDDAGDASMWDGATWSTPSATGAPALSAVSCLSSFCMAVSDGGEAVVYSGGQWHRSLPVDSKALTSVSCTSPTFCAATDASNRVLTFSGMSWTKPTNGNVPQFMVRGYDGVSCVGPSTCVAVDTNGKLLFFGPGAAALRQGGTPFVPLTGVSCASISLCVAVDEQGRAITFKATPKDPSFSHPERIDPYRLTSVSCVESGYCLATDDNGGTVAYDHGTWSSPSRTVSLGAITAVSCITPTHCMATDATNADMSTTAI
jgi:hypothetical protein